LKGVLTVNPPTNFVALNTLQTVASVGKQQVPRLRGIVRQANDPAPLGMTAQKGFGSNRNTGPEGLFWAHSIAALKGRSSTVSPWFGEISWKSGASAPRQASSPVVIPSRRAELAEASRARNLLLTRRYPSFCVFGERACPEPAQRVERVGFRIPLAWCGRAAL